MKREERDVHVRKILQICESELLLNAKDSRRVLGRAVWLLTESMHAAKQSAQPTESAVKSASIGQSGE